LGSAASCITPMPPSATITHSRGTVNHLTVRLLPVGSAAVGA
jgi:hypothetical protein